MTLHSFYEFQSKAERERRYLMLRALARELRERAAARQKAETSVLVWRQVNARAELAALVGASKQEAQDDAPTERED